MKNKAGIYKRYKEIFCTSVECLCQQIIKLKNCIRRYS